LVVIAIISILAALLLPALENALASARQAICMNNLKQGHIAMVNYSTDFDGACGVEDRGIRYDYSSYNYSLTTSAIFYGSTPSFINHGAWLPGEYLTPETLFCPDVTWELVPDGTVITHKYEDAKIAFGRTWREWILSYGASGTSPDAGGKRYINQVGYAYNSALNPVTDPTVTSYKGIKTWADSPLTSNGRGWHAGQLEPAFPILSDIRSRTHHSTLVHEGRGFNVAYADGAVQFLLTPDIVNYGVNHARRNSARLQYAQYIPFGTSLPIRPDDPVSGNPDVFVTQMIGGRYGELWESFYGMRR
jgi:prepilin-type processing-associated H-X9-DG protein